MSDKPAVTRREGSGLFYAFLVLVFIAFSAKQIGFVPSHFANSTARAQYIIRSMIPPTFNYPGEIFAGAIESIQVAVIGTLFGIVFSLILSVFAAKNLSPHPAISFIIKAFAALMRAVPAMVWALLFIVAVGLGPIPGIMALAIHGMGMLIKVYSEAIEEMDNGIIEALYATGGSMVHVIFQGVIPSVKSILISWSIFRLDSNIRYSTVLGIVGAGGIGWEIVRASRMADYKQVLGVTLIIFLIVVSIEYFSNFFRSRIDATFAKRQKQEGGAEMAE